MIFGPVLVPPVEGTFASAAVLLRYDVLCIKSLLEQLEMEMTQAKFVLAGLVAGLTLGGLGSGDASAARAANGYDEWWPDQPRVGAVAWGISSLRERFPVRTSQALTSPVPTSPMPGSMAQSSPMPI
jgi:hypothetical protein